MSHDQYPTTEDPLEGDVDKFVHPDETRSDEQVAHDDDVLNRLHMSGSGDSDDYWKEYYELNSDEDSSDEAEFEAEFREEPTNPHVLVLEKTIKERALASGMSQADLDKADAAVFTLKDSEGNPTDTLRVDINHYEGMYSRPGVEHFDLRPINGNKDEYGRDAKFVTGSFWASLQSPNQGAFSMSYAGNAEQVHQYAINAMQPEVLAQAEMHLHVPEEQ